MVPVRRVQTVEVRTVCRGTDGMSVLVTGFMKANGVVDTNGVMKAIVKDAVRASEFRITEDMK